MKKVFVLKVEFHDEKMKQKAMKIAAGLSGVDKIEMSKDKKLTVTGNVDPITVVDNLRKLCPTEILTVGLAKEPEKNKADGPHAVKHMTRPANPIGPSKARKARPANPIGPSKAHPTNPIAPSKAHKANPIRPSKAHPANSVELSMKVILAELKMKVILAAKPHQ